MRDEVESEIMAADTLSVIVPITKMAGRFSELSTWIPAAIGLPIQIVFIHDIQDSVTSIELLDFAKRFPEARIQIIEGTYGSPGLARNEGLKLALSPWVAFWDADDLPRPEAFISAIRAADSEVDVIIGNFLSRSGRSKIVSNHQGLLENVAVNPALWRMAIRSSILEGINFSSCLMGEDQIFLIDLNLGTKSLYFSNEIFYEYFQGHPMQLTMKQKSVNEVSIALSLAKEKLQQNSELQNIFSEIVLLRLFGTTLVRTRGEIRLKCLMKNLDIFFIPSWSNFARFVSVMFSSRKLK